MKERVQLCLLLVFFITFVPTRSAWCDAVPSVVYDREDLYHEGLKAYKGDDYVTALKDLYAFEVLNYKRFQTGSSEEMKSFQTNLDASIKDCENKLRTVIDELVFNPN